MTERLHTHIQTVTDALRNETNATAYESFLTLLQAMDRDARAVDRLILHCLALGDDLKAGLDRGSIDLAIYDEFALAPKIALGLVDPYQRGGRIPY